MHVLSADEMQACDRATTERFGVSSIDLMRAAASAVAVFARQQFPRARRMTVVCGRGNNGGDGMMAARLLARAGLEVTTILLGAPGGLKGDAAEAWRELTSPCHGMVHMVESPEDLARYNGALEADLIVDAVLGTGFKPPLKGLALAALEWLGGSGAPCAGGGFAFRLASGRDQSDGGWGSFSCRCGDHFHRAQAGARLRPTDPAVGSAGGGGAYRLAGRGDSFGAQDGVGRFGPGPDPSSARDLGQQGQLWPCPGSGRIRRASRARRPWPRWRPCGQARDW